MTREGFKNQMCSLFKSLRFFNIVILMFCFTTSSSWPIGVGVTLLMTPLWIMSIYDTYKAKLASVELDRRRLITTLSDLKKGLNMTEAMIADVKRGLMSSVTENSYLNIAYSRIVDTYYSHLYYYEVEFANKDYGSSNGFFGLIMSKKYKSMIREALKSTRALQRIQRELLVLLRAIRANRNAKPQEASVFLPREVSSATKYLNVPPKILKDMSIREFKSKIFRPLVKTHHPDNGGSTNKFQEVQKNLDILEKYLKGVSRPNVE